MNKENRVLRTEEIWPGLHFLGKHSDCSLDLSDCLNNHARMKRSS